MVVQMRLTRGLAAATQFALCAHPTRRLRRGRISVTPKSFAQSNRYTVTTLLFYFLSGVTPQTPCRRHILKNQKYYGILVVAFSKGNFPNPFGVRRAPSEPALSVFGGKKNPASKSHFTKQDKTTAIIQFLSLFSYGDSPPSYYLINL